LTFASEAPLGSSQDEARVYAAAATIQAGARGLAARQRVALQRARRLESALRLRAVTTLQRYWRGTLARRLCQQLRAAEAQKRHAAAITVQSCWRGTLTRVSCREARAAVALIQRCWRGTLARRLCRERRAADALALALRLQAVFVIQRCWRGTLGRRVFRERRAEAHARKLHNAALTIQRYWRGALARLRFAEMLLRHRAARRLQSVWRGVSLRSRMRSAFEEILSHCDSIDDAEHGCELSTADFVVWDPERLFAQDAPASAAAPLLHPHSLPVPPQPPPSLLDASLLAAVPPSAAVQRDGENVPFRPAKETWGGALSAETSAALAMAARRTRTLHARHEHEARMAADPLARAAAIAAKVGGGPSPERRRPVLHDVSPERPVRSPPAPRLELAALPAHLFDWEMPQ